MMLYGKRLLINDNTAITSPQLRLRVQLCTIIPYQYTNSVSI